LVVEVLEAVSAAEDLEVASAEAEAAALVGEAPGEAGSIIKEKTMKPLITVLGPTASGKTALAVQLAYRLDGEVVSADSRQVYRRMDIGTGKDLSEYTVNDRPIPYHLIDIREPGDKYTLFNYQHDFHRAYENILTRGKQPILCGGTGLYIESVLKGYDLPDVPRNPELRTALEQRSLDELSELLSSYRPLHNTTDTKNKRRVIRAIEIEVYKSQQGDVETTFPAIESVIVGLMIDREVRRTNITARLRARLQGGMIKEVEQLLTSGVAPNDLIYYGLEYKFVTQHVIGELSREEMYRKLEIAIHQFAKRQMTWFRGMERRGFTIHWIDASLPMEQKVQQALSWV
jgi:tRNA dimethylallyltransferase